MATERRGARLAGPALLMLLAALCILWLGARTDIDLALADAAFSRGAMAFPLRHAWLTDRVAHTLFRRVVIVLGMAWVGVAAWDLVAPRCWSGVRRAQVRVVALSAVLVPVAIALLKQLSASHCPWDLQRYGGTQPYVRLLDAVPDGVAAGNCMPAGHASSALWLISLAVLFLPHRPRTAGAMAMFFMAMGFAIGWIQQLRGAHFLTHTLWSMWIACVLIGALVGLNFTQQAVAPQPAPLPGNARQG